MAKETNQLKFGDFQVIVIMVAYSQKVLYLGYVLKKVPNHYPEFFHFTCFTLKSWGLAILLEMIKLKNFLSTYTNKKSHFGICIRDYVQVSFVGLLFAILFLKNVQFFSLFAVLFYSEFVLVLKTVCFWNLV